MIARRLLLALVLALLAVLAAPAALNADPAARDPEVEAQVKRLASELRCPVCQGVSIDGSPTELANEMKDVIRQQLLQGDSPEEVKEYFVARYGEWILLQPKATGFNLTLYILPMVMLLVGMGFVVRTVRRWSAPDADELALVDRRDDSEE
jgi:cytochrome c-type biogenesis protein CcmH